MAQGIWFVYRTHYEGPLSKRIRHLRAKSVLDWFARKMQDASKSSEPRKVANAELGGAVYGLGSFFEAVKENGLTPPKTIGKLRELLEEHLYVEGSMRLDAKGLRVKTDDDEVDLAYFFFDDATAKKYADRLAYLLHDKPRLPQGNKGGRFKPPMPVDSLGPSRRKGEGTTYACLFTFNDSESMPGSAHAFAGVRLPELAEHLRNVIPDSKPSSFSAEWTETWPIELRLLRAMVGSGDDLESALKKCAAYPSMEVSGTNSSAVGLGPAKDAAKEFAKAAKGVHHDLNAKKAILHASEHAALLCVHATKAFGYQQWILFDDRWAVAHPKLASSILRYASGWDPFSNGDDDDDDD